MRNQRQNNGVYIVLLNWNGWGDTIACLESLQLDMNSGARVVVCDNASTDGSLDHIERWAEGRFMANRPTNPRLARLQHRDLATPLTTRVNRRDAERGDVDSAARLILVDNGDNLGFAAGNNVGLRFALSQTDMTHVWLLNNDTLVEPDCLEAMRMRLIAHSRPAVCGSVIHFYDDPEIIQCIGGNRFDRRSGRAMESEGRFTHEGTFRSQSSGRGKLDYLSGCSMLLPRAFLETVGLMNEDYFLYYEEIDWFTRAADRFDLVVAANARLYHREGGSIGSRTWGRGPSLTADRHMFRSRIRFVRDYHPRWLWRCTLSNWLDVAKRLARGQWRNAVVISGEILRRGTAPRLN